MDIRKIISERNETHGNYMIQSGLTQALKMLIRTGPNWEILPNSKKEALDMFCLKMARILCGNPNHEDHWDDIAGYAELGKSK